MMATILTLINQYKAWLVLGAAALLAAFSFICGYKLRSLVADSEELAAVKEQQEITAKFLRNESKVASGVESALAKLDLLAARSTKDAVKIITRPVYVRECFDADGLQLLEAARTSKASAANAAK